MMPEFEGLSCDVVAVSGDTRGKACSFVSRSVTQCDAPSGNTSWQRHAPSSGRLRPPCGAVVAAPWRAQYSPPSGCLLERAAPALLFRRSSVLMLADRLSWLPS